MTPASIARKFLLTLALPCCCGLAGADTSSPPVTPPPPGQSANPNATQGSPVLRSHGHDLRPGNAANSSNAATPATSASSGK